MMRGKVSISLGKIMRKCGAMEALTIAKKVGAEAVDYYLAPQDFRKENSIFSKSDDEICEYYANIKRKTDELGLEIGQTHGFYPPAKSDDEEYNTIVVPENVRRDCMATKILGAPICVFHPVGYPDNQNANSQYMYDKTFGYIKNSLAFAKKYGIKFGLETVGSNFELNNTNDYFGSFAKYTELYSQIDAIEEYKGHFACCVDVGHTNTAVQFGEPTPGDLIRKMGKKVEALHLHDNDGYRDQHTLIGKGTVNWIDVFDALYEIGYTGNYNSEVYFNISSYSSMIEEAEFTVKTIKDLLSRYNLKF